MDGGSIFVCQNFLTAAHGFKSVCRVIVKGDQLIFMEGGYSCGEFVREIGRAHV